MAKKRTPLVPPIPYYELPSNETVAQLQEMSKKERKALAKDPRAKKYTDRISEREKQLKRNTRREWWKTNWISIIGLLLAAISIIISLVDK